MTKEEAKQISEIFAAYAEGKTIQFYFEDSDEVDDCSGWTDVPSFDRINIDNIKNYRIKPEQKLRPYKDGEEFLNAQKEHGPMLGPRHGQVRFIPLQVSGDGNYIVLNAKAYESLSFKKLIDDKWCWVWQDGTPCGILEE